MKIKKGIIVISSTLLVMALLLVPTATGFAYDSGKPWLTELVYFRTSDGVRLAGQFFEPQKKTNRVLILIPGGSGTHMRPPGHDFKPLSERLNKKGISLLLHESRHAGRNGWLFLKDFGLFAKDTHAAIQAMKDRGYTDIALFGISFGGPRLSYYFGATEWDPSVKVAGYVNTILSIEQAATNELEL